MNHGKLVFSYVKKPELLYDPNQISLVHYNACACGCGEPRIVETNSLCRDILAAEKLENQFLAWSSVLDLRAEITESGMALELVVFPGESLPKVPSAAKLKVRAWQPEDVPFCMQKYVRRIPENFREKD